VERGLESPPIENHLIRKKDDLKLGIKVGAHVNNRINPSISEGKRESPNFSS
jgi:hypothetical protein